MLGHFPVSSTVHSWLYGSSSVDRAEAGTAGTPMVIRGDIAPETVCWHHEVGTWSKRKPTSHINNLWKCASNFFAYKNQNKSYGKAFPIPPSMLAWLLSADCLKAKVCWCLWFSSHKVSSFSLWSFVQRKYLWLAAEVGFPLSCLSGFWEASSEPTSELFSSCLAFSSHVCCFNNDSAFSNRLNIQIDSSYLKVIYP